MKMMIKVLPKLNRLIEVWCERRCLKPLSYILQEYPFDMDPIEEWEGVLESLKQIKAICCHELAVEERKVLAELIVTIQEAFPEE